MSRRLTNEEFILKAKELHHIIYDYSNVEYINSHTKILLKCDTHGHFSMKPNNHLNGQGCPKCGKSNITSDTEEFIKKSKKIHGDKYDYSEVDYIGSKDKVKLICKEHGIFEQLPNGHLNGSGCPNCSKNSKVNILEFILRASKTHNNFYNYEKSNYKNISHKIDILCPTHGIFSQKPSNHLNGNRCPKCARKNTQEHFINKSTEVHDDLYDYSLVEYKSMKDKVTIICKEHGKFNQIARNHINSGYGCPKCGNKSKGEEKIKEILDSYNIKYKSQKTFADCREKNPLHFDFFIPEYNLCIEYDGVQHFKLIKFFGGTVTFEERLKRDKIKNKYCTPNRINLIRIPYSDYDNIESILNKKINVGDE